MQRIKDVWFEIHEDTEVAATDSKLMILALIGVLTTQHRTILRGYRTENDMDVPGPVTIQSYQDSRCLKFCTTQLLDTRTMLPIAAQCKFNEILLMEKASRILESIPVVIPLAARVDGIYFAYSNDDALRQVEAKAFAHSYPISQKRVYQIKDECTELPINPQGGTTNRRMRQC